MKIALDIGGSKTKLYWANHCHDPVTLLGEYGLASDSNNILPALAAQLDEEISKYSCSIDEVLVNLGGKNVNQIMLTLQYVLGDIPIRVTRESEGDIALEMMEVFHANVVVMAGTGCIAFGASSDSHCVIGGWGKEIGDTGCGYSLGMSAIQKTLQEIDSHANHLSQLACAISGETVPFKFSQIQSYAVQRDAVRSRLPKTRSSIAALTHTVIQCAYSGCPVSLDLVKNAGSEIGDIVVAVANKLGLENVRVVVHGGMTHFANLWANAFIDRVTQTVALENYIFTNDGIGQALIQKLEK